jgi:hypothetical protein
MSEAVRPSYLAKVRRAKEDIINLQVEIERYIARKPYRVIERSEGKHKPKVRRLDITSDPMNTEIPAIAGVIIYELRSALDHLMTALIPNQQASRKAQFPIYFQGVWEPKSPRDDSQRIKDRGRWSTDTQLLPDLAITILKSLQPLDISRKPVDESDILETINQLANTDDHTKSPVTVIGFSDCILKWKLPDGTVEYGTGHAQRDQLGRLDMFIENHAKLKDIPYRAMNVEIEGTPLIAIKIASQGRYVTIPDFLIHAAHFIENRAIMPLLPYVVHR